MVFGWFPWFFKVVSWFNIVFGWFPCFFKQNTTKLYPGPTIQSRPCRPLAGFGLVMMMMMMISKSTNLTVLVHPVVKVKVFWGPPSPSRPLSSTMMILGNRSQHHHCHHQLKVQSLGGVSVERQREVPAQKGAKERLR